MQENVQVTSNVREFCGFHFLKSGLWYFIIGLIVGFGVLVHYLVGSNYGTSQNFLANITLWFGSPLSLSAGYLQLGGLGMGVVGAASLFFHRHLSCPPDHTKKKSASLTLCHLGMMALLFTGYIGYFVIDMISPGFYYVPLQGPKNIWLLLQGLSILIYLIGLLKAAMCVSKCKKYYDEHPQNGRAYENPQNGRIQ